MPIVPENLLTLGSQSTASEYKSEENFEIAVDSVSPPWRKMWVYLHRIWCRLNRRINIFGW
jgi:hypothetical protein